MSPEIGFVGVIGMVGFLVFLLMLGDGCVLDWLAGWLVGYGDCDVQGSTAACMS